MCEVGKHERNVWGGSHGNNVRGGLAVRCYNLDGGLDWIDDIILLGIFA